MRTRLGGAVAAAILGAGCSLLFLEPPPGGGDGADGGGTGQDGGGTAQDGGGMLSCAPTQGFEDGPGEWELAAIGAESTAELSMDQARGGEWSLRAQASYIPAGGGGYAVARRELAEAQGRIRLTLHFYVDGAPDYDLLLVRAFADSDRGVGVGRQFPGKLYARLGGARNETDIDVVPNFWHQLVVVADLEAGVLGLDLDGETFQVSGASLGAVTNVEVGASDYEFVAPAVVFIDDVEICGRVTGL